MNDLLNISTEIPHLNLPNSCIHNSLRHDDHSINSFSSIRAGSVTVTGKKQGNSNCLSPSTLSKQPKLPIPLQTLSRIKKQNNQVKKILKKTTKTLNQNQPLSPRMKSKHRTEENNEKLKSGLGNTKNSLRDESPKSFVQNEISTPKMPMKLKQHLKKEGKNKASGTTSSSRLKRQIDKQLVLDFEKLKNRGKVVKGIVVENKSLTPKGKLEGRKCGKGEKGEKGKKKEEVSEVRALNSHKKLPIDLGRVLRKSKTRPKISLNAESSTLSLNKRNSESMIKNLSKKNSKKKLKKPKKSENIFKDLKKKLSLDRKKPEFPKPPKFRPMQREQNLSEIKKTLEFLQSEADLDPDPFFPQPKQISQPNPFSSNTKENSAILIQSHVRKYLAQKKYKNSKGSFSMEDNEVKKIISGWKKDSSDLKKNAFMTDFKLHNEGQLDSLQKLKAEEINQIKSAIKNSNESPEIIETITKIINSRYQNIAKIMQNKYENKHGIVSDHGLLYRISEDSENFEEIDKSESLSDSYKEDKVWSQITETAANTKDNSVTPNKSEYKLLIPSDIWQSEADALKCSLNPSPSHSGIVTSENVLQIAEKIIEKFLGDEISKYIKPAVENVCDEVGPSFEFFLESGIEFLFKRFDKIEKTLSRPLRKNPLEVLAKVQGPYTVNPLKWCFSVYPSIIPPSFCEEFSSSSTFHNMSIYRSQVKLFFDCSNEVIQQIRPFGDHGALMPWSQAILPKRSIKVQKPAFKLFLTEKLSSLNSIKAGKIPDTEYLTENQLNEDKLHRIREEKIGVLIAQDIKKNENLWVDYEFEYTQTKVILSEKIFDILLNEIMGIVSG